MPANEALKAHVTRVGFDLSLGKTHVSALVLLNETLAAGHWYREGPRRGWTARSMFVPASHGLEDRGLIEHTMPTAPAGRTPVRRIWKITKAGRLVINLLKEAGLYDEYLADLGLENESGVA